LKGIFRLVTIFVSNLLLDILFACSNLISLVFCWCRSKVVLLLFCLHAQILVDLVGILSACSKIDFLVFCSPVRSLVCWHVVRWFEVWFVRILSACSKFGLWYLGCLFED